MAGQKPVRKGTPQRGQKGGSKDHGAKKGGKYNPKKAIAEKAQKSFKRGGGDFASRNTGRRANGNEAKPASSARTRDVDLHVASKVSHDFTRDINAIKEKLQTFSFGELDAIFALVPPTFVMQHLPDEVSKFRSYFSKFQKGAKNDVVAFVKWYEWASYEAAKTLRGVHGTASHHHQAKDNADDKDGSEAGDEAAANDEEDRDNRRKKSQTRSHLAQVAKEREHMRALLQMCLRHNSTKRREGQHALINRIQSHMSEQSASKTFAALKENAHHSVSYAISRLVVGMVTENFANVALYCHTLHLLLKQKLLHPRVLLTLIGEELALDARMKAQEVRLRGAADHPDDEVDPDSIADPTKGERNQRIAAAIFTMGAVIASLEGQRSEGHSVLSAQDAATLLQYLSFCYVEHKGLRVLSGNLITALLQLNNKVLSDPLASNTWLEDSQTWKWIRFAWFRFPKMEYFRPEAVQMLLYLMELPVKPSSVTSVTESDPSSIRAQEALKELVALDPLEPMVLEQIANALFRRDQVTDVHPMVHPVWVDLLDIIRNRCMQGESLKQHISSFVHNVIAPYRRGASDSPRSTLFTKLVEMVGSLALQHDDTDDRMEVVRVATKTIGFGKQQKMGKTTPIEELKKLDMDALHAKVVSLISQLRMIRDHEAESVGLRTWTLKELRACLLTPFRYATDAPHVNLAVKALLQQGFFPANRTRDELNMNRAVYLFAEVFSFTYAKDGGMCRLKATIHPNELIAMYLEAEESKKTRFFTAVQHPKFRKARNRIVEALESSDRSVLFYESRDMHILLALLFFMLSVDDQSNDAAINIATTVVPDLVRFYKQGTIETLDVLYDVMMALVMRPTAPLHILPLMTAIRRIATGYLFRFARHITNKSSLDFVLAPLVDGYETNEREAARNRLNDEQQSEDEKEDEAAPSGSATESSDSESSDEEADDSTGDDGGEADDVTDDDGEADDATEGSSEAEEDSETDDDEEALVDIEAEEDDESVDSATEEEDSVGDDDEPENTDEDPDDADEFVEEEEAPTQQYLNRLQQLAGGIDLGFAYPTDTESKAKADVVRSIRIASRVGLGLRSPLVVHVFQVLLAVMRSEVKNEDTTIFDAARSGVQMLMMSRQRYFGKFLPAEELMQLLGDIQTYCRKLARFVIPKDRAGTRHSAIIRRRLDQLKLSALSVFHYTCFLAFKNHAGEAQRIAYGEFYQSIFYDRGWDEKHAMSQLKRDIYHYRHAFAWALLPAAVEKFATLREAEGPQRVRAFRGACAMIEAAIPRISGLPLTLKTEAASSIRQFIEGIQLKQLYDMKQTELFTYFRVVKFALQYNSKIHLNTEFIHASVDQVIDDDTLQVTKATIRVLASIEKVLDRVPKITETKAPVPVQVLYKQFETTQKWRKEKSEFYRKSKITKKKTAEALLAHRNQDPTDEERAKKRRRREVLKERDVEERAALRAMRQRDLTKEEKEARRKRQTIAKQERIAKNKDRKRVLHEKRTASFERWRQAKLANTDE